MKREIKFRVWDDTKKAWVKKFMIDPNGRIEVFLINDPNNLTLSQYTGLKDVNGVEIYEGDFIKCGETIQLVDSKLDWNCGCCGSVYGYWMESIDCNLVIGNIHENPELLK